MQSRQSEHFVPPKDTGHDPLTLIINNPIYDTNRFQNALL